MPFLFTESKAARRLSNTPNKLAHNIDKPLPFGTLFPAPDDTVEGFSERNTGLLYLGKVPLEAISVPPCHRAELYPQHYQVPVQKLFENRQICCFGV